jgi:hypothetical protein
MSRQPHSCFLVLEKRGRSATSCTTHELNALNTRLRDAAADCLMLTEKVGGVVNGFGEGAEPVRERELRAGWPRRPECLACGLRKGGDWPGASVLVQRVLPRPLTSF